MHVDKCTMHSMHTHKQTILTSRYVNPWALDPLGGGRPWIKDTPIIMDTICTCVSYKCVHKQARVKSASPSSLYHTSA